MPDNNTISNTTLDLTGEACAWIAQLETGDMSSKDILAFREWVGRSPKHFREMQKIARLSGDIDVLADLAGPLNDAIRDQRALLSWRARANRSVFRPAILSAVVLFAAVVFGVLSFKQSNVSKPYIVSTEIGGLETVELSDGSVVTINTASQVEVSFDKDHRRVRLLKGEALFDVAHNPDRPFVVYAGDKTVKAVGTAFSVRWTNGDISVTVSEGKVLFTPSQMSSAPVEVTGSTESQAPEPLLASAENPLLLAAGQKLSFPRDEIAKTLASYTQKEIRSELSWKAGILDFTQKPLFEIVDEISRYTEIKIEITDAELRELKFSGIFRTGETSQLFEALDLYGVEVERVSDSLVRLHSFKG